MSVQLAPDNPEIWNTLHKAYTLNKNQETADEYHKIVLNLIKQKKERGSEQCGNPR